MTNSLVKKYPKSTQPNPSHLTNLSLRLDQEFQVKVGSVLGQIELTSVLHMKSMSNGTVSVKHSPGDTVNADSESGIVYRYCGSLHHCVFVWAVTRHAPKLCPVVFLQCWDHYGNNAYIEEDNTRVYNSRQGWAG